MTALISPNSLKFKYTEYFLKLECLNQHCTGGLEFSTTELMFSFSDQEEQN